MSEASSRVLASGRVVEIVEAGGGGHELVIDGLVQSHVWEDAQRIRDEYQQRIAFALDLSARGRALRILHVGAGALTLGRHVALVAPDSEQVFVEREAGLIGFVLASLPDPGLRAAEQLTGAGEEVISRLAAEIGAGERAPFDRVIWDVYVGDFGTGLPRAATVAPLFEVLTTEDSLVLVNVATDVGGAGIEAAFGVARSARVPAVLLGTPPVISGASAGNAVLACGPLINSPGWRDRVLAAGPHPPRMLGLG